MTTLRFTAQIGFKPDARLVIGPKSLLADASSLDLPAEQVTHLLSVVTSGKSDTATHWNEDGKQTTVVKLDDTTSRNLGTIRGDLLSQLVATHTPKEKDTQITLLCTPDQVKPGAYAIARAFPLFNMKSTKPKDRTVVVKFATPEPVSEDELQNIQTFADGVRQTARLVDTPTCFLNTHTYLEEVEAIAKAHPEVKLTVYKDEEVKEQGLTALWAVGKCAEFGPVFVLLEYSPKDAKGDFKLGLVGKGIVYDTGGLQLKPGASMCGMKTDMGGSAAILSAFEGLVKSKFQGQVAAILCIAENAIGPKSYKNDDIVTSYSGKTMEINNTDAEGRVVLSDGVAYMSRNLKPTHMLDMATLTGAQMMNTGMHHAAVLSNDPAFEQVVFQAGQASGDWVFPILYAPELLSKEFDSKVADMKNSVKDRMNAQASCAGHFIEQHIDPEWKGAWTHVDIAGPSFRESRATGFGTALIIETAHRLLAGAK